MDDDELSAAVAKRVMGWMLYDGAWGRPGAGTVHANASDWRAATDWNATAQVIETMRGRGWRWSLLSVGARWHAIANNGTAYLCDGKRTGYAVDASLPRAVCLAALAAVDASHD